MDSKNFVVIVGLLGCFLLAMSVDHNNTQNSTSYYEAVSLVDVWQPPPPQENHLNYLRKHVA